MPAQNRFCQMDSVRKAQPNCLNIRCMAVFRACFRVAASAIFPSSMLKRRLGAGAGHTQYALWGDDPEAPHPEQASASQAQMLQSGDGQACAKAVRTRKQYMPVYPACQHCDPPCCLLPAQGRKTARAARQPERRCHLWRPQKHMHGISLSAPRLCTGQGLGKCRETELQDFPGRSGSEHLYRHCFNGQEMDKTKPYPEQKASRGNNRPACPAGREHRYGRHLRPLQDWP